MVKLKWNGPTAKHIPYQLESTWLNLSLTVGEDNLCLPVMWEAAKKSPKVEELLKTKLLEVVDAGQADEAKAEKPKAEEAQDEAPKHDKKKK